MGCDRDLSLSAKKQTSFDIFENMHDLRQTQSNSKS